MNNKKLNAIKNNNFVKRTDLVTLYKSFQKDQVSSKILPLTKMPIVLLELS